MLAHANPNPRHLRRVLLAATAALSISQAHAQTASQPAPTTTPTTLNEIIVTGTRQSGVKVRDSATPITIISGAALQKTGQITLRDALTQLDPAIARVTIGGDTAQLTDVLTIHGLSPNHVLILINGKRRHATANIQLDPGAEQGATGVDIDLIPVSAIDHIEILSEGDSAQYGSDAIAGVINIILKSASQGGSFQTSEGEYYAGDGFSRDLAANTGTTLVKTGFLNLSAEYAGQNHTFRGGLDPTTNAYDNLLLGDPATNRELLAFNAGKNLANGLALYSFGTYGHRDGDTYQNIRPADTLLNNTTGLPVFPNGFIPRETIAEDDYGLTAGIKGKNLAGWNWDLSTTYGGDWDNVGVIDSANLSEYADFNFTPTSFHVEDLTNKQWTNNLDFTRAINAPILPAPLTVSWGIEHRLEIYQVGQGDPPSQYGTGAQALPGLTPLSTGSHFRNAEAGDLDLATKITPAWLVDAAGRFEHYSDFGNTTNGKVSTRYDLNPHIAIRASAGTAFQAPTLAQEYFTNLNVSPTDASGQLAPNSAIAKSLGALPLKPETSENFDAGLILNPAQNLNLTADAYEIDVQDRVVDGGTATGAPAIAALQAAGFTLQPNLAQVYTNYFTNGANTRTRGIDLTASYLQDLQNASTIAWDLAANYNDTGITKIHNDTFGNPELNLQETTELTDSTPKYKLRLGGNWQNEKFGLSLHENIYGPSSDQLTYYTGPNAYSATAFQPFHNPITLTTDIEARYAPKPHWQLAIGANNLFNSEPKQIPPDTQYLGTRYDLGLSGIGIDGGLYYFRARYVF